MKTIGVTGYKGRLGRYLLENSVGFVGLDIDVTNPNEVNGVVGNLEMDCVLHLAAKSDVDWCEKNQSITSNVNLRGTFNVCRAAQLRNIPVVLLSSDHVFGGEWGMYKEKDKGSPVNYYGFTKLSAESLRSVFDNLKVVRTSYLFDRERLNSELSDLWDGKFRHYPTFITRTFMYLPHFAITLHSYLDRLEKMPKLLHLSGSQSASWYDLMREVAIQSGQDAKLIVPRQQEKLGCTPRPYRGGLNTKLSRKLGFLPASYKEGFHQMLKDWK